MNRPATIAIIPAFNEAGSICGVVTETLKHVDEVLVIDDGSNDKTAEEARRGGAKVIVHATNQGIGSSLRTGYAYCAQCKCDLVVQLDADGQHDPRFISSMIRHLIEGGYDVVTGSRFLNKEMSEYPLIRRTGIRLFSSLAGILSASRITDITSGFRVYRQPILRSIAEVKDRHWAVDQTLRSFKLGLRYSEFPVVMPLRRTGRSQFDPSTLLFYPLRMSRVLLRVVAERNKKHKPRSKRGFVET